MQAHPVPQNITGFEFKLVGFMTIRQFGYLAAAGITSFIIYILPLFGLIKIALIFPLALLALALAFLPVNDIPFDRWLVSFIRSVYTPAKRVWHKEPKEIGFLAPEFSTYLIRQKAPARPAPADRHRLENFLASKKRHSRSVLDSEEEKKLADIGGLVSTINYGSSDWERPPAKSALSANPEVVGDVTLIHKLSHG